MAGVLLSNTPVAERLHEEEEEDEEENENISEEK